MFVRLGWTICARHRHHHPMGVDLCNGSWTSGQADGWMDSPRLLQLTVHAEEEYMRCRYTGKVNKLIILFPAIAWRCSCRCTPQLTRNQLPDCRSNYNFNFPCLWESVLCVCIAGGGTARIPIPSRISCFWNDFVLLFFRKWNWLAHGALQAVQAMMVMVCCYSPATTVGLLDGWLALVCLLCGVILRTDGRFHFCFLSNSITTLWIVFRSTLDSAKCWRN